MRRALLKKTKLKPTEVLSSKILPRITFNIDGSKRIGRSSTFTTTASVEFNFSRIDSEYDFVSKLNISKISRDSGMWKTRFRSLYGFVDTHKTAAFRKKALSLMKCSESCCLLGLF